MARFVRRRPNNWRHKFACAGRGLRRGVRTQISFFVHLVAAALVAIVAAVLQVDRHEWLLLTLCVTGVLTAEMFNTALERMAPAISRERDPRLRDALDMASAGVLLAALGSVVVGLVIFGRRLIELAGW